MKKNQEKEQVIKDERIEELTKDYVWIDIKKFCELKGICIKTFYKIKNLDIKTIERKKYIKVQIEKVNSNKYMFINKNNKLVVFTNSHQ